MNSLKTDYSFVEPTWKLPALGAPSTHAGAYDRSYLSSGQKLDPDMSTWTNTTHNSRYIPPNTNRGTYPQMTNQQLGDRSIQSGPSQSFQQQGERFMQPAPPPAQSYQQPGEHFMQPAPPLHPVQSYQQQGERFMQPGPPPAQSYQQQGEHFIQPAPPMPSVQSYQQQGERFMQPGPPLPPIQSYQQSNDHYRNNENYNDDFDITGNVNSNDGYNMLTQPRNNGYSNEQNVNQGFNYSPPPQPLQKRVPAIAHNQQAFFSDDQFSIESTNSYSYNNRPSELKPKAKPRSNQTNDNKFDGIHSSSQRPSNFNIHEYLYGLSAPDSGSYVNVYKNQRRRLQDEKVNHKSVITEYKNFLQSGGFGPAFGNTAHQTYEEKLDAENKRKSYSKLVREINQHKLEEQKRIQNNSGQERTRTYVAPTLRRRRPEALSSHLLFTPEVREFERKIKREHDANCKCSLHSKSFSTFS